MADKRLILLLGGNIMSKIKKFPVTYKGANFTVILSDSRMFYGKLNGYDVKIYMGEKKWNSSPIYTVFLTMHEMHWADDSGTISLRSKVEDLVVEAYDKIERDNILLINKQKYEKDFNEWNGYIKPY